MKRFRKRMTGILLAYAMCASGMAVFAVDKEVVTDTRSSGVAYATTLHGGEQDNFIPPADIPLAEVYKTAKQTCKLTRVYNSGGTVWIEFPKQSGIKEIVYGRKDLTRNSEMVNHNELMINCKNKPSNGKIQKVAYDYNALNGRLYDYQVYFAKTDGSYTCSNVVRICNLNRPMKVQATSDRKSRMTVRWNANTKADFYRVFYSKNKNMSGAKSQKVKAHGEKAGQSVKKSLSGLKAGRYYVNVRAYKTVDGVTYHSGKSERVKVTITKKIVIHI